MIKSPKRAFIQPTAPTKVSDVAAEHPAIAYMNGFIGPLLKAEPHLWQLLEATRITMAPEHKKESYLDTRAAVKVLLGRPKLLDAFTAHPDVMGLSAPSTDMQNERQYVLNHNVTMARRLMQMGAFRSTKYIIKPHPELEKELFATDLPQEIPTSALLKTPSWAMYLELGDDIKAGTALAPLHGIFVANLLEGGKPTLEMTGVGQGYAAHTVSVYVNLGNDLKVSDAIATMQKNSPTRTVDERSLPVQMMRYALNMMLYMSSKEPDYNREQIRHPVPKPSLRGFYYPEPKTTTEVGVGVRLGSALMQAKQQMTQYAESERKSGRTMPPHVRRAHYHAFRVGPRKIEGTAEEQRALLAKQDYVWHWLPSIPVNVKDFDKLQAVRRAVEAVDSAAPRQAGAVAP